MAIRYVIRRKKRSRHVTLRNIYAYVHIENLEKLFKKDSVLFSFSSRPLAEYSSWMFLTTKHPYRVNKFIINWFADEKNILRDQA